MATFLDLAQRDQERCRGIRSCHSQVKRHRSRLEYRRTTALWTGSVQWRADAAAVRASDRDENTNCGSLKMLPYVLRHVFWCLSVEQQCIRSIDDVRHSVMLLINLHRRLSVSIMLN